MIDYTIDVAKLIDQGAFYEPDDLTPTEREIWRINAPARRAAAQAKATKILAYLRPRMARKALLSGGLRL